MLGDDSQLDSELKPIKIGGKTSILELSETSLRISGNIHDIHTSKDFLIKTDGNLSFDSLGGIFEFVGAGDALLTWNSAGTMTLVPILDKADSVEFKVLNGGNLLINTNDSVQDAHGHILIEPDGHIGFTSKRQGYFYFSQESNYSSGGGAGFAANYLRIHVAEDTGATEFLTTDADAQVGHMTFKPDGNLILDPDSGKTILEGVFTVKEQADAVADVAGYGQIWVHDTTPCDLMFTDDAGNDIIISRPKNTAVWGGNFARTTGHNGKWLGIPTGYQAAIISFGTTDSAPDTTYSPSTTADDLCSVIWKTVNGFEVTSVQFFFAQGGATNTAHRVCLMRYDIDADGDLTNGAEVCDVTLVLNSDDYSHLRFSKPDLTSDVEVSSTQVLIAMVYCVDAINAAMGAKCILEYKESIV